MSKQVIDIGTTANDGTGDTLRDAFDKVNDNFTESYVTQITGITLSSASWSLVSGLYEYDYSNEAITADSIVEVIPDNGYIAVVKAAEILPKTVSSAGNVKMYATNAPTKNIGVTMNLTTKDNGNR